MRGLITRPLPEAQATAQALAARGIEPVLAPLQQIVALPLPAALDFSRAQAILLTSAHGARALARTGAPRTMPVLAVGSATAHAAHEAGFTAVADADGDGATLAELCRARLDPQAGALLHIGGEEIAFDLAAALAPSGFTVRHHALYRAEAASALPQAATDFLRGAQADLALFFSPRAAFIFVSLAQAGGWAAQVAPLTAFALSAAVGDALAGLNWRQILVAPRPDQASLLAILDSWKKGPARP